MYEKFLAVIASFLSVVATGFVAWLLMSNEWDTFSKILLIVLCCSMAILAVRILYTACLEFRHNG